jgi:hypothetical protein
LFLLDDFVAPYNNVFLLAAVVLRPNVASDDPLVKNTTSDPSATPTASTPTLPICLQVTIDALKPLHSSQFSLRGIDRQFHAYYPRQHGYDSQKAPFSCWLSRGSAHCHHPD